MAYGNCGDCEYWKDAGYDGDSGNLYGQCRINPPVFVLGLPEGMWPRTEHYAGCGRNEPLPVKPAGTCVVCKKPDTDCECIPF